MILLLESLHPDAEALLATAGAIVRAPEPNVPPAELASVRAILTRGRGRIPEALLARCPALRAIARAGAGLDNLDTRAAARRGVTVIFAPGANTNTVAEHTLALMLDLARGITRDARAVAAGRWEDRARYRGDELGGLTLGIVGFGSIGRRVAELAAAFRMRVVVAEHGASPSMSPSMSSGANVERLPLRELLAVSDVVTLHVPLNTSTKHLIDAERLACMRRGALLINTARGALIDTAALRDALASGRLGGFAADVLDVEPPSADDPLLGLENVVLTPHVASLTSATYRELCVSTATNVVRVLRDETPEPRSVFRGA
ncbi:MAG: hydroxyacid dehydrogenase [Planctomycetes bacterium]|nr:hydroxyacid dehydrogenase [Planctomycetota bacterium]